MLFLMSTNSVKALKVSLITSRSTTITLLTSFSSRADKTDKILQCFDTVDWAAGRASGL